MKYRVVNDLTPFEFHDSVWKLETFEAGALALRCGRRQVLTARCWRRDDRLMLPDSRGERSVKRLLSERGIPPEKRETLPVFCVDGALAAVWGVGVDRSFLPETSGENLYITM